MWADRMLNSEKRSMAFVFPPAYSLLGGKNALTSLGFRFLGCNMLLMTLVTAEACCKDGVRWCPQGPWHIVGAGKPKGRSICFLTRFSNFTTLHLPRIYLFLLPLQLWWEKSCLFVCGKTPGQNIPSQEFTNITENKAVFQLTTILVSPTFLRVQGRTTRKQADSSDLQILGRRTCPGVCLHLILSLTCVVVCSQLRLSILCLSLASLWSRTAFQYFTVLNACDLACGSPAVKGLLNKWMS